MSTDDVIEITTLQSRYANLFDQGRLDELMQLFVTDSSCDLGVLGQAEGADAVAAQFRRLMGLTGVPGGRMHALSNAVVDVDPDRSTAVGEWALQVHRIDAEADTDTVGTIGYYRNSFRRVDGRWMIVRIVMAPVWTLNKAAAFAAGE